MRRLVGAAVVALVAFAQPTVAQQLDFKRLTHSGDETLSYRWRGVDRRERIASFTLTRQAIGDAERSFEEFSMEAMWRQMELALRDETRRFSAHSTIDLTRNLDGMRWQVTAVDQHSADLLMNRLAERFEQEQRGYLARYLRQRVGQRIMVDFSGATAAQQQAMRAVADALGKSDPGLENDRARIATALGFFQEIPYVVLEDKARRGGDFLPAPALLAQNRGDCDSKAVALAAVLRSYTPWRKLAVVTMPDHAILAADLPAQPGDVTVRSQGRQYVTLEAAGPAINPVGRVGTRTARYLREGREIEIWPLN